MQRTPECRRDCATGSKQGLVIQDSADLREANVFRAHAAPQGMCDNLINALKLLTIQQKDGDSPVGKIVTGLLEKSRQGIMDGFRKFIEVDCRAPRHKVRPDGEAKVHGRFLGSFHPGRCG